jgi:hypothetical protein
VILALPAIVSLSDDDADVPIPTLEVVEIPVPSLFQ